jgi:protein TonB
MMSGKDNNMSFVISGPGSMTTPLTPNPVPPKPGVKRITVGGNVQAALLISQAKPVYPPLAKQARIQGTVKFAAIIADDGTMRDLQVISGHPLLVPAAIEAVKTWKYQPTLLEGAPVEVATQIDVNFTLTEQQ